MLEAKAAAGSSGAQHTITAPVALMPAASTKPRLIEVLEGQPLLDGTTVVVAVIITGDLIPHGFQVDYRNHTTKKGYQRHAIKSRITKLARDLRKMRVDLPTSVLLNLRGVDPEKVIQEKAGKKYLVLQVGEILWAVDGQHRLEALEVLFEEWDELTPEAKEHYAKYKLHAVIMIGADEWQEMTQFHVVNANAKSVKTDLAADLLKTRAEGDEKVMTQVIESGQEWRVTAMRVIEKLAENSAIWNGRVRFGNEAKVTTTVNVSSFISSLNWPLKSTFFDGLDLESKVRVVDAYWQGLRMVLPQCFGDPAKYVIQKGQGVMVLHRILEPVITRVQTQGRSVFDPKNYAAILEGLTSLGGDNEDGDTVEGEDFWSVAPSGAAGAYSSSAGQKVLVAKLKELLPSIKAE